MFDTKKPEKGPGRRLRLAVADENPLQIAGTINAYSALLAQEAGFHAIYLSGAGVANASLGLPDLGLSTLEDVVLEVRRITRVCRLPLLVDADTGFGEGLQLHRTVDDLIQAGAAGLHLEDQVPAKRCGHRPNKVLVAAQVMADRIELAAQARSDPDFVLMARTDALAVEGMEAALDRARLYVEAGADMVFPEALTSLAQYARFCAGLDRPVLANMTEFGQTPLFHIDQLAEAGVALVLYPLSAFRAMSQAALDVYTTVRKAGTQRSVVARMQTRESLYGVLRYHEMEERLDRQLQ